MSGRLVPAIETLSRSLEVWPKEARDGSADYADGLSNLSLFLYWRGDYKRSTEVGRDAVDRALGVQSLQSSAQGTSHVALSLVGLGRHIEAIPWFEKSVQLGLDWEALPRFSSRTMNMWAGAERELMNFGRARELSQRGLEMARQANFAPAMCSAQIDLFVLELAEGRYDAAEQALPGVWRAASQVKGIHEWLFQIRVGEAEALLQLAAGRAEQGVESARQALAKAEELGRKKYVSRVSATLALCLLNTGRAGEASDAATRALATAREIGNPNSNWRAADVLARSRLAAGDDAGATAAHSLARQEVMRFAETLDADRAKMFYAAPEVIAILGPAASPI
jgi:tetratricopeptide (TPR) repeat protein